MTAIPHSSPGIPSAAYRDILGRIAIPVIAVVAAFLVGLVAVMAMGVPLDRAVSAFINGAFGSTYSISASLNRSVSLALVGIGFVIAARAGLTNVGGEGQIAMGGVIATALCLAPGMAELPFGLSFIVPLLGGAIAGGVWGAIAGFLKVLINHTCSVNKKVTVRTIHPIL